MDDAFVTAVNEQIAYEFARTGPPVDFPRLPDLPLGRYSDEAFWQLERQHVFGRSWIFAAHVSELPSRGSYRSFELVGRPLLLTRGDDDTIRGFFNACRHRGAPVVRDECGSCRLLVCHYHSWSYDLTGHLVRVPDERDFVGLQTDDRSLVSVRCEVWGGLVFVNLDPHAEPLLTWLGALVPELAAVVGADLRVVRRLSTTHECNWKVMAEGFLEVYHAKTIHPSTVAPILRPAGSAISLLTNGHSRMITPLSAEAIAGDRASHAGLPMIDGLGELFDTTNPAYGIFPNLITPLDKVGFPILQFWPLAVDRTRLERVWLAPAAGVEPDLHPTWSRRIEGFEIVMDEDTRNLEPIQRSVESAAHGGIPLNYQERRIWHLHATIDMVIEAAVGLTAIPAALRVPDLLSAWVER